MKKGDVVKQKKGILMMVICCIGLMACSRGITQESLNDTNLNSKTENSQSEAGNQMMKTELTIEAILELAQKQLNGKILSVEYEVGHPNYYQVTMVSENSIYELNINSESGDLLNKSLESDEGLVLENVQLSIAQAISIALAKTGGGMIRSIQLEHDELGIVYDVEVEKDIKSYDLKIDANDGSIVDFK